MSEQPQSTLCLDDASYVLGSLSPAERQAFEQHLATCRDCQASVARLAGLPGLLGLTSAADLEQDPPPVPDTLLPRLLRAAARQGRRRRWIWTGTMAAAAACVVALVITLVLRPATPSGSSALPAPVAMEHVVPGPMNVSLQLVDKQWGTSIVVNCHYESAHEPGEWYDLVAYDAAGKAVPAGGWKSVSGAGSVVTTATALRLSQISRVEVQLPDGTPVLFAVPPHG
ncbi:Putative zinc-finger [Nakamurella panacisegetis]|uniref:Putative zinc-finger n=1 Tax=Nakamurella panacisegetis TaxID=1090615 RepID=A0A1H0NY83_9ACTN|nr:zf-HC2 domain-containing protein [Nakamurella panacisegetis]SDO97589.1 Putative zinc-finger [Nakamurella panacisegetis]